MSNLWVVWSEEHGAWWGPNELGYVKKLAKAGRYSEREAREIERRANQYLPAGVSFHEVAMPDPVLRRRFDEERARDRR